MENRNKVAGYIQGFLQDQEKNERIRNRSADRRNIIRNSLSNSEFGNEPPKKPRCQSAMPASNRNLNKRGAPVASSFLNKNQESWLKYKAQELLKFSNKSQLQYNFKKNQLNESVKEAQDESDDHDSVNSGNDAHLKYNNKREQAKPWAMTNEKAEKFEKENEQDVIDFIDNLDMGKFMDKLEEKYQIPDDVLTKSLPIPNSGPGQGRDWTKAPKEKKYKAKALRWEDAGTYKENIINENDDQNFKARIENKENLNLNLYPVRDQDICNQDSTTKPLLRENKDRDSVRSSVSVSRTIGAEELEKISEQRLNRAVSAMVFKRNSV
jgi:hypothetical protein